MNGMRKLAEIPVGSWTKWVVVGFWVVVLVLALPLSRKLTGAEKNDAKYWLPGNAESTKVLDVQSRFQSPDVYTGVVVYVRPSGITVADRAKAAVDAHRFAGVPGVVPGRIVGPIVSADGKAIETILQVNLGSKGYADANKAVDAIRAITSSNADGLVVHITGPLGGAADSNNVFKSISGTLLYSALAVVILILLITYRSPVLWLLPVVSSGVALITAQAVIYLLAAHAGLTVNGLSAGILEVLVFGASTDYALLIVARYREELRRHDRRHPAMATALRRAGPAIIASAATVVLALLTLTAADLNSTSSLGPVLAIGVAVGMFVMITLLPALLVTFPRGVFWPYRPTYGSAEPTHRGMWARVGWRIASRPRPVWIASALVGGATATALDVERASAHDRTVIIPLILAVVFIILGLLLRALVAPLILTATVVLSFAAALGVSAFFFNHVFGFGGADTSFPLFVFVFLVALGIDYNIFLMTRVREEAIKRDARHGAIIGLAATGGVITSAGFVLAGTFAVLATIPSTQLTEIGFAVAFGVLLDTIVVRSVLVTALNLDVGRWMWWRSSLARKPDPAPEELSQERAAALTAG